MSQLIDELKPITAQLIASLLSQPELSPSSTSACLHFQRMNKMFEAATEDEENAVNVMITNDMTREDVVGKILEMVNDF